MVKVPALPSRPDSMYTECEECSLLQFQFEASAVKRDGQVAAQWPRLASFGFELPFYLPKFPRLETVQLVYFCQFIASRSYCAAL